MSLDSTWDSKPDIALVSYRVSGYGNFVEFSGDLVGKSLISLAPQAGLEPATQ